MATLFEIFISTMCQMGATQFNSSCPHNPSPGGKARPFGQITSGPHTGYKNNVVIASTMNG